MREIVAGYCDAVLESASSAGRATGVRDDLIGVVAAVEAHPNLREVLTDPGISESIRRAILTEILEGKVSVEALALVRFTIRSERPGELQSALASLVAHVEQFLGEAGESVFTGGHLALRGRLRGYAERVLSELSSNEEIDEVEDESFRLARLFDQNSALRSALTSLAWPPAARIAIVDELLASRVQPTTLRLVHYLLHASRLRDLVGTLDWLVDLTAQERGRRIGEVRSAVDLGPSERDRLADALGRLVERPVEVRVIIDPTVVGGAFVAVGDLVIDGTVRLRLERLRDLLARRAEQHKEQEMAELTITADEIAQALEHHVGALSTDVVAEQVGRISEVGDGIAHVTGLPQASVNEILEFENGAVGLALNLDEETIGAVVLGVVEGLDEGQVVRATGRILSVPVGDGLLGRVVNPLGEPIDGKGPLGETEQRRLEVQAPGIVGRQPVTEPLQTGIKVIDAMTPIGRGQRELIIGDRKTGKTTIAIDTIINQRGSGVKCIYVAVGQKGSTVAQVVATLEQFGALEYTVVVSAPASEPAPFKYIAPYVGCAMGQHWMEKGEHALVVYDDLSKQADAYRQLSLLLRRPPGREAYPGDVFYLHSRLLERAAKLSDALGAGSLTALPIIETKAGDISAYIPTNVISITDGQIFLEADLFNAGVRPAMNVGNSVSRVGGAAQVRSMKAVVGSLKIDLAQFRDLEAFATFGSELDKTSQAQLDRGYRLTELLKQGINAPLPVEEQIVVIFAGVRGLCDPVPIEQVSTFEENLRAHMRATHAELLEAIRTTGTIPDEEALTAAILEVRQGFVSSAETAEAS